MKQLLRVLFPKTIASLQREAIAALKPQVICEHCSVLLVEGDPRLGYEYGLCDECTHVYEELEREVQFYDTYYDTQINDSLI
jgi:hypothetical protein